MKKISFLFKCILPVAVFILLSMFSGALIYTLFHVDLSMIEMPAMDRIIKGMLTTAIIQCLALILVALRTPLGWKKLTIFLAGLYFLINHGLNFMESVIYTRNIYPLGQQIADLISGLITSLVLGFIVAGLWGSRGEKSESSLRFNWSKKIILPWIGWILLWFLIYFTAGALIPMNSPGVYEYYFSDRGAMDLSLVPLGYLMQIPRGSLWILMAISLYKNLKGSDLEKQLITGILFGAVMSSSLLIPGFLMPDLVRLSHLPEILFANLLWGFLISSLVGRHFRNNQPLS